ncbi:F-box protein SKIP2 [Spatholobus suberectus]|nr:F-box protein SKIP2 [Spatholobus suberectus]
MGVAVTVHDIPDDCLASIFQLLSIVDRNICSLVCRRWLKIEGHTCHRLYLIPPNSNSLSSILSRFDSVTELTLPLRFSRATDAGLESFARSHRALKKFSCQRCDFGYEGLNALVRHCGALEELSVTSLRGATNGAEGGVCSVVVAEAVCLMDIGFFSPILGAKI